MQMRETRSKTKTSPTEALRFELTCLAKLSKDIRTLLTRQIKAIDSAFDGVTYEQKLKATDTAAGMLRNTYTNMAAIARALQAADELKGHEATSDLTDDEIELREEEVLLGGDYGG